MMMNIEGNERHSIIKIIDSQYNIFMHQNIFDLDVSPWKTQENNRYSLIYASMREEDVSKKESIKELADQVKKTEDCVHGAGKKPMTDTLFVKRGVFDSFEPRHHLGVTVVHHNRLCTEPIYKEEPIKIKQRPKPEKHVSKGQANNRADRKENLEKNPCHRRHESTNIEENIVFQRRGEYIKSFEKGRLVRNLVLPKIELRALRRQ